MSSRSRRLTTLAQRLSRPERGEALLSSNPQETAGTSTRRVGPGEPRTPRSRCHEQTLLATKRSSRCCCGTPRVLRPVLRGLHHLLRRTSRRFHIRPDRDQRLHQFLRGTPVLTRCVVVDGHIPHERQPRVGPFTRPSRTSSAPPGGRLRRGNPSRTGFLLSNAGGGAASVASRRADRLTRRQPQAARSFAPLLSCVFALPVRKACQDRAESVPSLSEIEPLTSGFPIRASPTSVESSKSSSAAAPLARTTPLRDHRPTPKTTGSAARRPTNWNASSTGRASRQRNQYHSSRADSPRRVVRGQRSRWPQRSANEAAGRAASRRPRASSELL